MQATVTLNPASSPATIDYVDADGEKCRGIYELEGDTLRLCLAKDNALRPETFAANENGQMRVRLKRVKSADTPAKGSYYGEETLEIKNVIADDGKIRIVYRTRLESMWHCPGANAKVTEKGVELTFVRAMYNQRPEIDYLAAPAGERSELENVIIVEPNGKPIFLRSGDELKQIWEPREPSNPPTDQENDQQTD